MLEHKNNLIKQLITNETIEGEPFIEPAKFKIIIKEIFKNYFSENELESLLKEFYTIKNKNLIGLS